LHTHQHLKILHYGREQARTNVAGVTTCKLCWIQLKTTKTDSDCTSRNSHSCQGRQAEYQKKLRHNIPLSCISQTKNMRCQSLKLVGNINDQQYIRFVTKMIPQTFKLVPSMSVFCTLGTLPSVCVMLATLI